MRNFTKDELISMMETVHARTSYATKPPLTKGEQLLLAAGLLYSAGEIMKDLTPDNPLNFQLSMCLSELEFQIRCQPEMAVLNKEISLEGIAAMAPHYGWILEYDNWAVGDEILFGSHWLPIQLVDEELVVVLPDGNTMCCAHFKAADAWVRRLVRG